MSILEAVRPTVDKTIAGLAGTKFVVDPIAGTRLSRITSIISSAYKRHGAIIEVALFHAINAQNAIEARNKVPFFVTRNASSYVESRDIKSATERKACLDTSLPYQTDGARYEIDILYFDHRSKIIVALEVKRGNGQFDRGKRDSMIKSALTVRTLLQSYAATFGWEAHAVESRILAYYGVPKFPPEIYLRGKDLDTFVGPGVQQRVEEVNDYFRAQLMRLIEGDIGQGQLLQ
ncbi:MAG: hypothetical protein AAF526_11050 [Pseudomonadota bacterium]